MNTPWFRALVGACCLWAGAQALAAPPTIAASASVDMAHIEQVMKAQFDRPQAPLMVGPVSVLGGWAVAGWTPHAQGGRALLKREAGQGWMIHVCAGDGLKDPSQLRLSGLTDTEADALVQQIQRDEQGISPERLRQLALFRHTVKVQGADHLGRRHAH